MRVGKRRPATRGVAFLGGVACLVLIGRAPALAQATGPFPGDPAAGRSLFLQRGHKCFDKIAHVPVLC